jgi:hypothetical protein
MAPSCVILASSPGSISSFRQEHISENLSKKELKKKRYEQHALPAHI